MGRGGEGVLRWVEREIIYLSLHCHHQTDSCIKMGSVFLDKLAQSLASTVASVDFVVASGLEWCWRY